MTNKETVFSMRDYDELEYYADTKTCNLILGLPAGVTVTGRQSIGVLGSRTNLLTFNGILRSNARPVMRGDFYIPLKAIQWICVQEGDGDQGQPEHHTEGPISVTNMLQD